MAFTKSYFVREKLLLDKYLTSHFPKTEKGSVCRWFSSGTGTARVTSAVSA